MAELPVQIPDSRDMGPLGIQAQLKQIEVEEIKKGFREEFEAAYATGVRAEVEAVFEKYAGRFTYLANTRMFNKSIVLQTGNGDGYGSKARPRMKQYLDEIKNQLYGAARNPKAKLRENYENMPDDEFMKFANVFHGVAQTRLDRVMNIYINAAKKCIAQMEKAHNEAVGNVQAKINTAKATAANRRQAVDSVVSALSLIHI